MNAEFDEARSFIKIRLGVEQMSTSLPMKTGLYERKKGDI